MDGIFDSLEDATQLTREVEALYTNGPAGGGGITTGTQPEIKLVRSLVPREDVTYTVKEIRVENPTTPKQHSVALPWNPARNNNNSSNSNNSIAGQQHTTALTPKGKAVKLWSCAHSRAGDKDNRINISVIPFNPDDFERFTKAITPDWVYNNFKLLLDGSGDFQTNPQSTNFATRDSESSIAVSVYSLPGPKALNIVIDGVLDGGVAISRRIDRHGKTLSDILLQLEVILD